MTGNDLEVIAKFFVGIPDFDDNDDLYYDAEWDSSVNFRWDRKNRWMIVDRWYRSDEYTPITAMTHLVGGVTERHRWVFLTVSCSLISHGRRDV